MDKSKYYIKAVIYKATNEEQLEHDVTYRKKAFESMRDIDIILRLFNKFEVAEYIDSESGKRYQYLSYYRAAESILAEFRSRRNALDWFLSLKNKALLKPIYLNHVAIVIDYKDKSELIPWNWIF